MCSNGFSDYNSYCNRCCCRRYYNPCISYSTPNFSTRSMCLQNDACLNNTINSTNPSSHTCGAPSCSIPMQCHTHITTVPSNDPEPIFNLRSVSAVNKSNIRVKNDIDKSKIKKNVTNEKAIASKPWVKKTEEPKLCHSKKSSNENDTIAAKSNDPCDTTHNIDPCKITRNITPCKTRRNIDPCKTTRNMDPCRTNCNVDACKTTPDIDLCKATCNIDPCNATCNIEIKCFSNKEYSNTDADKCKSRLHSPHVSERTEKRNNFIKQSESVGKEKENKTRQKYNSTLKSTNGKSGSIDVDSKDIYPHKVLKTNDEQRIQPPKQSVGRGNKNKDSLKKYTTNDGQRIQSTKQLSGRDNKNKDSLKKCTTNDGQRAQPTKQLSGRDNKNKDPLEEYTSNDGGCVQPTKQSFAKDNNNCCCYNMTTYVLSKCRCSERCSDCQINDDWSDEESVCDNCPCISFNNSDIDCHIPNSKAKYVPFYKLCKYNDDNDLNENLYDNNTPNNLSCCVETCPNCNKKKFNYSNDSGDKAFQNSMDNEGHQKMHKSKSWNESETYNSNNTEQDNDGRAHLKKENIAKKNRNGNHSEYDQTTQKKSSPQTQRNKENLYEKDKVENAQSESNVKQNNEPEICCKCQCVYQKRLNLSRSFSDAMLNVHIFKGKDFDEEYNECNKYNKSNEHQSSANNRYYEDDDNKKFIQKPKNCLAGIYHEWNKIMTWECSFQQQLSNQNRNKEVNAYELQKRVKKCNFCCSNLFKNNQAQSTSVELVELNNNNSERNEQEGFDLANTLKCQPLDLHYSKNSAEVVIIPEIPCKQEFQDSEHEKFHLLPCNNPSTVMKFKGSENQIEQNKSTTSDVNYPIQENEEQFSPKLHSTFLPQKESILDDTNGNIISSMETSRPIVVCDTKSKKLLNGSQYTNPQLISFQVNLEVSADNLRNKRSFYSVRPEHLEEGMEIKNNLSPVNGVEAFAEYADDMKYTLGKNAEGDEELDFANTQYTVNFSNLSRETKDETLKGIEQIKCYCHKLSEIRTKRFLKNTNKLQLNESNENSSEATLVNGEISETREASPHQLKNGKTDDISNQNLSETATSNGEVSAISATSPNLKNIKQLQQIYGGKSTENNPKLCDATPSNAEVSKTRHLLINGSKLLQPKIEKSNESTKNPNETIPSNGRKSTISVTKESNESTKSNECNESTNAAGPSNGTVFVTSPINPKDSNIKKLLETVNIFD